MARYIKYCIPDYILCLLMAVGISVNVYQGFYLPAALSVDFIRAAVVTAALLVFLFWAAYSNKTVIWGIIIGVVLAAAAIVFLYFAGIPLTETADEEANGALWYMLTLAVALGVFLLARTPAGTLVLMAVGTIIEGLIKVMRYDFYLWAMIVFVAACLVTYVYKRYRKNIFRSDSRKVAFFPMIGYSLAMVAISVGLATGIWFGILANYELPYLDIRLITQIMSIEVLEKMGISQKLEILDHDLYSSLINDEDIVYSNQIGEEETTIPDEEERAENEDTSGDDSSETQQVENENLFYRTINYLKHSLFDTVWGKILVIVLILLVVGAVVTLIAMRRRIWWRKMLKIPPRERAEYLYNWSLKRFTRLGIPGRGNRTPNEYADYISDRTGFLTNEGADWQGVTDIMVKVCYANEIPDAENEITLEKFFTKFHKNCKKRLGWRYLYKYFRL